MSSKMLLRMCLIVSAILSTGRSNWNQVAIISMSAHSHNLSSINTKLRNVIRLPDRTRFPILLFCFCDLSQRAWSVGTTTNEFSRYQDPSFLTTIGGGSSPEVTSVTQLTYLATSF